MAERYDAIVIGGGHNGLTAAAYLARPRRPQGAGARAPPRAGRGRRHRGGVPRLPLLGLLVRRLAVAPRDHPRAGPAAARPRDPAPRRHVHAHARREPPLAHERPRAHAARDLPPLAARRRGLRRVRAGHGGHGALREADPVHGAARAVRARRGGRARHGAHVPALPRAEQRRPHNLLQLMTVSAVDLLDRWFETDVLKATMSASGIIGTFLGVRSPGTAYVLLHHYMGEIDGVFRSWGLARGGTGAISTAIASAAK